MNKIKYITLIVLILSVQSVYAAKLLYSTGFETETAISQVFYTNNTEGNWYPPDSKVAITSSNPHSGSKSIRGNVHGGIDSPTFLDPITRLPANHDPHLALGGSGTPAWGTTRNILSSSGKHYISYWMRWDSGANFRRSAVAGDKGICAMSNNPGSYKMVIMSNQNNMDSMFLNAGVNYWNTYDQSLQLFESKTSVGHSRNDDGVWHHYEYLFQYETAVDAGNGSLKVWRDGVLLRTMTGLNFKTYGTKTGAITYSSFSFIQFTASACESSGYQIDDIEVWDDMPTQLKSIIPPTPTDPNLSPNSPKNLIIN